jgi:hypothetical protein
MAFGVPDLFDTGGTPGLAPRAKLDKGGGSAGGFGGDLLSSAAGALGVAQADPLTDALSSVVIELVAAPGLATCRLRFLPRSDFPALALGDSLTVKLGSAGGDPVAVFAGSVAKFSVVGGALDVMLAAPAAKLARIRRNSGYESQGFGDLLSTWATEAGLEGSQVDRGPDYAFFAIDDRLSLWDWIARVARHADVPAWTDAQGRLNARKPAGAPVATFRYGETVLALRSHARDPVVTGARIVGEGSAGRPGSDAWSWLAMAPQGVSAGAGGGLPVEQDGGLRDLASVVAAALGASAGSARIADMVELRVPGSPAIDIASVFALENCPGGEGDGSWRAAQVRHLYSASGFVTEVVGVGV